MTLIEKLEAATEGSRDFDLAIQIHIGRPYATWNDKPVAEGSTEDTVVPLYTTSLDAAMTLVPEGYDWRAGSFDGNKSFNAVVTTPELAAWDWDTGCNSSANPALALAIAALKARGV